MPEPTHEAQALTVETDHPAARQDVGVLGAILADAGQLEKIPVDTVERLFALHEREVARDAELKYNAAFARVQSKIEPIRRTARNANTGSMYAKVEHVERMLDPILQEEGFSRSLATVDPVVPDTMRVCLTLRHLGGHVERHYMDAPVDDKGPKGGAVKTRLHGTGSTMTYCSRYLLCMVFGITLTLDDDGNQGVKRGETVTENQAANLQALIDETKADVPRFLEWGGVGKVSDLPASMYTEAVQLLEAKR